MEVVPDQSLTKLVSNFMKMSRRLPKHVKIARAEPQPENYVLLAETVRTEAPVDTVVAVQRELRLTKRQSACVLPYVTQPQKKAINEARDLHETV